MENIAVNVGSIIKDMKNGTRYRVLFVKAEYTILCQMDTTKLNIAPQSTKFILESLMNGTLESVDESKQVYNYDSLTLCQQESYRQKLDIINRVVKAYGPTYLDLVGKDFKEEFESILKASSVARSTLLRWIRIYLQSGFDIYSLINTNSTRSRGGYGAYSCTKKVGRPSDGNVTFGIPITDNVLSHFRAALEAYKSGRQMSYEKAYVWMLNTFYSTQLQTESGIECQLYPATERPTFDQFYYFARCNLTQQEKDIIKTSSMEVRNNRRLLLSDVLYGVSGPCDRVQMDECEVDISLVSMLHEDQSIGRPIVYAMIDVYTRMILAIGVAFDNNSVVGMTNCFLNLAEDKVNYCAKYDITISEKQWPSGYLPNRILVDRGSEYISRECSRIFNEINITRELVPAGTGSLKGSIEQWFHQMQSSQNASLERHGYISKRHDSKHHKESCLTLDDFTIMLINFVVYHNTHIIENYPVDSDMVAKDISPIPTALWEYGCRKFGTPRKILNLPQFCYSLMLPQKATISRKGIKCNGLYYLNAEDSVLLTEMYAAQNKCVPFECRIDPRDIGSIYYIQDNQLLGAPLNTLKHGNASFAGLTLSEWNTIYKFINQKKREGLLTTIEHSAYLQRINELIVKSAIKNFPTDTTNMVENRSYEKHFIQNRSSMYFMLCDYIYQKLGSTPEIPEDIIYASEDNESSKIEPENVPRDSKSSSTVVPPVITDEDWLAAFDAIDNKNS